MTSVRLRDELVDQLDFQWQTGLRPRLDGLSDDEYRWEPVPDCWTVRAVPGGHKIDFELSPPEPPPVTTIAWRIGHLTVPTLRYRVATHFERVRFDFDAPIYAGTSAEAVSGLEGAYAAWVGGLRRLSDDDLWAPSGEPGFETDPMITLVLHINREVIHHGAEIGVLRDLYRAGLR